MSLQRRRRAGFPVFIDKVSKRIHQATLGKAFHVYGTVLDVFIAYKNVKRRSQLSTFSFVRNVVVPAADTSDIPRPQLSRGSMKDSRSFKDALLGIIRVEEHPFYLESIQTSVKSKIIHIPKSNIEWWNCCLVGSIKRIFNTDIIHEALVSDRYPAIVCPWDGLLVVVRFLNKDERLRCWANRNELLKHWFDELEFLEGFDRKRRVKTWIKLLDVQLDIWSIEFFRALGGDGIQC
ncbi:hypothetical protein V6N13_088938 [Hibiscus sabdariffa]